MNASIRKLTSKLTKREGKKSSIKMGDAREFMGLLAEEIFKQPRLSKHLFSYGRERIRKKLEKLGKVRIK